MYSPGFLIVEKPQELLLAVTPVAITDGDSRGHI
jgi:hypothetical protein